MGKTSFGVGLIWVFAVGCGSSDASGPSGAGGAGGTGGAAGSAGKVGAAGAAGKPGTSAAPSGTIGNGSVDCSEAGDGKSCSAGMACCDQFPFAPKACVASFEACQCADPGAGCGEVDGCDGPEDCPGGVCCATHGATNLHQFTGTSCKPSCDPQNDTIVCKTDADCPSHECNPTGTSFSQCL